ncbi:hypothetical protein ILYODFUR_008424 [Ilyodon furcidens]|uniref:Uncharacterized protein n=1 Tax=Ilyodon furcidens TaxID=33524 RepID=A0ABV0UFR9_9TELE
MSDCSTLPSENQDLFHLVALFNPMLLAYPLLSSFQETRIQSMLCSRTGLLCLLIHRVHNRTHLRIPSTSLLTAAQDPLSGFTFTPPPPPPTFPPSNTLPSSPSSPET